MLAPLPETKDLGMLRSDNRPGVDVLVKIALGLSGATMLLFGFWSLLLPRSFAALIDYPPYNEHLLHDLGAFQIGIGVAVMTSIFWRDAIAVAFLGFISASALHTLSHIFDRDRGGHLADPWALGFLTVVAVAGFARHLRTQRRATPIH
jgi:hypothetical protein